MQAMKFLETGQTPQKWWQTTETKQRASKRQKLDKKQQYLEVDNETDLPGSDEAGSEGIEGIEMNVKKEEKVCKPTTQKTPQRQSQRQRKPVSKPDSDPVRLDEKSTRKASSSTNSQASSQIIKIAWPLVKQKGPNSPEAEKAATSVRQYKRRRVSTPKKSIADNVDDMDYERSLPGERKKYADGSPRWIGQKKRARCVHLRGFFKF